MWNRRKGRGGGSLLQGCSGLRSGSLEDNRSKRYTRELFLLFPHFTFSCSFFSLLSAPEGPGIPHLKKKKGKKKAHQQHCHYHINTSFSAAPHNKDLGFFTHFYSTRNETWIFSGKCSYRKLQRKLYRCTKETSAQTRIF